MNTGRCGDVGGESTSLSMAVIDAIATHEGVDPVELDTPIYDVIDLDALDALTTGGTTSTSIEVSFTYEGYAVTVDDEHGIRVETIDE